MLAAILVLPLLSHALLAAIITLLIYAPLHWNDVPWSPAIAGLVTATFFYGREAGQAEHSLKREGWSPVLAWVGAYTMTGWRLDNVLQYLAPAGAAALIAAILWYMEM